MIKYLYVLDNNGKITGTTNTREYIYNKEDYKFPHKMEFVLSELAKVLQG